MTSQLSTSRVTVCDVVWVWPCDADKLRQIERAVGVSGLEQEQVRRRGKWNKPQKDATESAWDSDTILDD